MKLAAVFFFVVFALETLLGFFDFFPMMNFSPLACAPPAPFSFLGLQSALYSISDRDPYVRR